MSIPEVPNDYSFNIPDYPLPSNNPNIPAKFSDISLYDFGNSLSSFPNLEQSLEEYHQSLKNLPKELLQTSKNLGADLLKTAEEEVKTKIEEKTGFQLDPKTGRIIPPKQGGFSSELNLKDKTAAINGNGVDLQYNNGKITGSLETPGTSFQYNDKENYNLTLGSENRNIRINKNDGKQNLELKYGETFLGMNSNGVYGTYANNHGTEITVEKTEDGGSISVENGSRKAQVQKTKDGVNADITVGDVSASYRNESGKTAYSVGAQIDNTKISAEKKPDGEMNLKAETKIGQDGAATIKTNGRGFSLGASAEFKF